MKKHILILVIVALALPFIQGEGCSGAIQYGPEEDLTQVGISDIPDDTTAQAAPYEPPAIPVGPVGIMQPEPSEEPAEEPEEPPAEPIDSGAYMPNNAELRMKLDANLIEQISMDHSVFDAYANIFNKFASMFNLNISSGDFIEALANFSLACKMDLDMPDADVWNIQSCKGLVAVAVFDADATDVVNMLDSSFVGLNIDENGSYILSDNIVARKIADNVYAFGTQNFVDQNIAANADNLFMAQKTNFEPAAMFFSANAAIADNVLANKMFAAFNILPQVMQYIQMNEAIKMDYLGAIEYVQNPSIAAAAYVIADNIMPIRTAIAMSYEDLVEFIKFQTSDRIISEDVSTTKIVPEDVSISRTVSDDAGTTNIISDDADISGSENISPSSVRSSP